MNLTRRKMIRVMGWLLLIPLAGLWDFMVKRDNHRNAASMSRLLLADIPQGRSFYSDYWINRDSEVIKVYSTRCTHLGCRVKPADEDDRLICPCHGSSFDPEDGKPLNGPAGKSLELLDFNIEDGFITIYFK